MPDSTGKDDFIYPIGKYYGEFTPEKFLFDSNLQEFSQRVTIICALENGGKLPPIEAYKQIKLLWKQLKASKQNLLTDVIDEDDNSQ